MSSRCLGWRTRSRSLGHGDGAGPRQYPSGSGTSGPGGTEWLPARTHNQTEPLTAYPPGEDEKRKGFHGGGWAARAMLPAPIWASVGQWGVGGNAPQALTYAALVPPWAGGRQT